MRFCCLGSGSEGNGLVVESGSTRILIDCGFAVGETVLRLARQGIAPESLAAVLVTHEHGDHLGGVPRFAARFGLPVWLTHGTLAAANGRLRTVASINAFDGHDPFVIGDIAVAPIPVPHDAREPVQFVFGDGARRLGLLTDLGMSTPHVVACLAGCDALVLECNHDLDLLAGSDYPAMLKARISGRHGHLANTAAADLLQSLDRSHLQHVIAAHLSRQNNRPEFARAALAGALGCTPDWVGIAEQDTGFDWRDIN
ncbi:MAG: MBL fold metallo-hydrolase [Betaproteobacteria bacterium]|nr:MBL fold metallo-hydrolase [Betaproteobacteria bacterium]